MRDLKPATTEPGYLTESEIERAVGGFSITVTVDHYGVSISSSGATTVSPVSFIRAVAAGVIKGAHT